MCDADVVGCGARDAEGAEAATGPEFELQPFAGDLVSCFVRRTDDGWVPYGTPHFE